MAYSIGSITKTGENQIESWTSPKELAPKNPGTGNADGIRTSGGWNVFNDTLIAFINVWPDSLKNQGHRGGFAFYRESADGISWGNLKPVTMSDGTPMAAVFEQDPHLFLLNGKKRLVNAAHFQPGLFVAPIYTDDLSGRTGWKKSKYTNMEVSSSATNSREMEPSLFQNSDGNLVMTFRDQNSTFYRLASISKDFSESWSTTELTNMPDSRAKQSAGNLPDSSTLNPYGTAYLVGNPVTNKNRWPLAITLGSNGKTFDRAFLLRSESELPARVYEGKAKTLGYSYPKSVRIGDYLYVAYTTNKELIEYTRIPLTSICDYVPPQENFEQAPDSSINDSTDVQNSGSSDVQNGDSTNIQIGDSTDVQKEDSGTESLKRPVNKSSGIVGASAGNLYFRNSKTFNAKGQRDKGQYGAFRR